MTNCTEILRNVISSSDTKTIKFVINVIMKYVLHGSYGKSFPIVSFTNIVTPFV